MYELSVKGKFSAAHQLRGYEGACESLHGHNWEVEVTIVAKELDSIGIAMDFKLIKSILNDSLKELDHKNLNVLDIFKEINPTSENIAEYIYKELSRTIVRYNSAKISKVSVSETENYKATYWQE